MKKIIIDILLTILAIILVIILFTSARAWAEEVVVKSLGQSVVIFEWIDSCGNKIYKPITIDSELHPLEVGVSIPDGIIFFQVFWLAKDYPIKFKPSNKMFVIMEMSENSLNSYNGEITTISRQDSFTLILPR